MDSLNKLAITINDLLSHEKIRRLLIQYFESTKGFEKFDIPCFPPAILDLTVAIPQLAPHVEVVPFVEHADIFAGAVAVGWNLCVAGQQVMFLGTTRHNNVADLKSAIGSKGEHVKLDNLKRTPEEIIEFIMKHLPDIRQYASTAPSGMSMVGTDTSSMYKKTY